MTSTVSLLRSASPTLTPPPPPGSPAHAAWLDAEAARIARVLSRALRRIAHRLANRWAAEATLTAALTDPGDFGEEQKQWEVITAKIIDSVEDIYTAAAQAAPPPGWDPPVWPPPPPGAAVQLHPVSGSSSDWVQVVNHEAVAHMAAAQNRLSMVGQQTWGWVRDTITTGLNEGKDRERIKREIEAVAGFSEYRADAIARTETHMAWNGGTMAGAQALGDAGPAFKSWLTQVDARTRPEHRAANEQTVAFRDPFSVAGYHMDHPGDPSAPAAQTVHCRCTVLLYYPGDTLPNGRVVPEPEPPAPAEWEPPAAPIDVDTLVRNPDQPSLGGGHEKSVYTAPDGSQWLFKPMDAPLAHIEAVGAELGRRAGLDVPAVHVATINGRTGSLQPMIANARKPFPGSQHDFDPTKVTAADLTVMQQHRVLDWMIGNHDGHAGQFVRSGYATSGAKVIGIDKGQAFRYTPGDKLDWKYHPNSKYGEAKPVANLIEQAYAEGRLDSKLFKKVTNKGSNDVIATAAKLRAIPDDEYRAMLRPYAKAMRRSPIDVETFLDDAVNRKNGLEDDFRKYHARLTAARTRLLGPATPRTRKTAAPAEAGALTQPRGFAGANRVTRNNRHSAMAAHDHPVTEDKVTSGQIKAIKAYTGSAYADINARLRAGKAQSMSASQNVTQLALRKAFDQLGPPKDDFYTYRGVYGTQYMPHSMEELAGGLFRDEGFMSTSVGDDAGPAFGGEILFKIRHTEHTRGAFVEPVSSVPGEREFLLTAGTTMYVHSVKRFDRYAPEHAGWSNTNFDWVVEVEVVDPRHATEGTFKRWDAGTRSWVKQ